MSAECLSWAQEPPPREALERVGKALERGALVALPTETVYGLAARADAPAALARLRQLKGSPLTRGFTWHVGSARALRRFPRCSPMAERLAERYWPGPLTLVLPGVSSGLELAACAGWTGVRCVAQRATAALLEALDFPVVATSANRAGASELPDARAILAEFGHELAFVIDGGKPPLGEASTVLRVGPGSFEVLRTGLIDEQALRRCAGLRIAFVCTGNTCRSPMAAGLARAALAERLQCAPGEIERFGFQIASMGLAANPGESASEHAVAELAERKIDLSAHRARAASPEALAGFERIYAVTRRHLEGLEWLLPPGRARDCQLLDPEGADVPDPVGCSRERYAATAATLERALARRVDEWA
jgi:tRNA threonylcarbamoyl adenosine modification protein (Sua5/YciO/YrdC/YwlC family)